MSRPTASGPSAISYQLSVCCCGCLMPNAWSLSRRRRDLTPYALCLFCISYLVFISTLLTSLFDVQCSKRLSYSHMDEVPHFHIFTLYFISRIYFNTSHFLVQCSVFKTSLIFPHGRSPTFPHFHIAFRISYLFQHFSLPCSVFDVQCSKRLSYLHMDEVPHFHIFTLCFISRILLLLHPH